MNLELVEKIAGAVLYEGYMLYPYRASAVKNRQRFNFGVLTPKSYSEAQRGTESYEMQTEVLLIENQNTKLDVKVRFLHLMLREVKELNNGEFRVVPSLKVGEQIFQTWQEAVEREVVIKEINLRDILTQSKRVEMSFPETEANEPLQDAEGKNVGVIVRNQQSIKGEIELRVEDCGLRIVDSNHKDYNELRAQVIGKTPQSAIPGPLLFKLTVRVSNTTTFENAERKSRDEALLKSLASAHTILALHDSEFISLLEPSDEFNEQVASCKNVGTFPVLVGEEGERDCVLSSPIILYDYPQIAPESAGDLFDSAEIDEILTLRIMTMTDEEKREMRNVDEHARRILERTENLPSEQLMKLHGAMKGR